MTRGPTSWQVLDGGAGVAVPLRAGQSLVLRNTHGTQVVDTWALMQADPGEYLSVEHTRRVTGHLCPRVGDIWVSNRRSPMLTLTEDSFDGTHDMLVACCDPWLYAHLGAQAGHANCRDNFLAALAAQGVSPPGVPNPVNLWMNVPVAGNHVSLAPPVSTPGDHVTLRAEADLWLVLSACPMDITPVNGSDCSPQPVHYRLLDR